MSLRSPWLFGLLAILPIPVLLFSAHFPAWTPIAALLWLGALAILYSIATKRWLSHTPADLILLALLLLLPLGLWVSADRSVTLPRTYALIANIALFYAIAAQAENRAFRRVGWLMLAAGLILMVATIPGTHFYPGQKLPFINRSIYDVIPSGLHLPGDKNGFNPNMTGGLLALFLPPALALSIRAENWIQRLLAIFTFLMLSVALLLTQSRGAILGAMVAVVIVSGVMSKPLRWLWWAGGLLSLGALVIRGKSILQAFMNSGANSKGVHSMAQRIELWSRALYAGMDFPFTGIGLGQFPDTVQLLYPTFQVTLTADVPHAHNLYLQALAEMGYPGLIVTLAFLLILLFTLIRRIRRVQNDMTTLSIGLLGSLTVLLVHGIVDVPTYSPLTAIVIWGMFGLMMAVGLADDHTLPAEAPRHD
jgi:O-antigen ligase